MKYAILIQVRHNSKRLPGKNLLKVTKNNLRLIEVVIKRIKKSRLIDNIILATSKKKDEELANSIEDYLPLVKAIIRMENGDQPYEDDVIVQGMYKAWEGHPTK